MSWTFFLGLAVAFGGALLLATGSELQSRAVFEAAGRWRSFLRSGRWWAGLTLLGTAVGSNLVALALAPVSIVQSVSIVALAASAAFSHWSGRAPVGRSGAAAIGLCAVGITGFVLLVRASLAEAPSADPLADVSAVTTILAVLAAFGVLAVATPRTGRLAAAVPLTGLLAAALIFGSITTVFKALVTLTLRDGIGTVLGEPAALLGLSVVAAGGVVANVLLQRSHHRFPAPVVVAGITIVDPLTAAAIGIGALGEVQLTAAVAAGLITFGAVACAGVLGLTRIRRREMPGIQLGDPPRNDPPRDEPPRIDPPQPGRPAASAPVHDPTAHH